MKKRMNQHICAVCGQTFLSKDLVPADTVRDVVTNEIVHDHPTWSAESFICRPDLGNYRAKYVHSLL